MWKINEYQFAELMQVAINQLAYCKKIVKYPWNENMFLLNDIPSNFYKRICNAFFIETCLIICNLLKEKDKRIISFFNWDILINDNSYKEILDWLVKTEEFIRLVTCRDQVFAHQDISNHSNNFPNDRLKWLISETLINDAEKILDALIKLFDCITREKNIPYDLNSYFWTKKSEEEIEFVIWQIKPKIEKISK